MKVIRNVKDPTRLWSQHKTPLILLLGVFLVLYPENTFGERLRRDDTEYGLKNVTCDAHESKLTCDCHGVNQHLQLPNLKGYVFSIEVQNCKALTVNANALEGTQGLRRINFNNIENLVLNKYALAVPRYASNTPLVIEFEKVNFELIDSHSISGNIEELTFIGGRIDVMSAFGFSTLKEQALLLKLDNVLVKKLHAQAFKKFSVEQLEIARCVFDENVPSKAFYELEVTNVLRIYDNKFKQVHSHAFSFNSVSKLSVTKNYFAATDAEWIVASVYRSITVQENHFGLTSQIAFKAITVSRAYTGSEPLELQFYNNTVKFSHEPEPFDFNPRFRINIKQLRYENTYACKSLDLAQKPPRPKVQFFQQHLDHVYFQRVGDNQSFVVLGKIIEWDCKQSSNLLYIILGVVALIILVIVALVVWLLVARKRKRRKMDVVMPEPRTYKETQIVYQIENAGLLKTDL